MDKKYTVQVDDNYHYMDESERYAAGSYSTLEEAIKTCEEITIDSLKSFYESGITAGKLSAQWAMFGEDPYITGDVDQVEFSARKFVSEELCNQIIKEIEGGDAHQAPGL